MGRAPSQDSPLTDDGGPALVTSPDAITEQWIATVLGRAGVLDGADVAAISCEPVVGGIIARMVRVAISYDGPTSAPGSLVVKYPTDDPGSLGLAQAMGMYELETRFYQDIAPLVPGMGLATCYSARLFDGGALFTLALEDLADLRSGDVLTAATTSECAQALGQLVTFQAPLWNSAAVAGLGWLADPSRTIGVFDALPAGLEPFLARFGDHLNAEHVKLFETVVPRAGEWVRSWQAPTVVQHGDFRSDNIMFSTDPRHDRVVVLDFQTVRLGPPGLDPAYYLGSSLPTASRREHERDLIREYHDRLVAAGVGDYDFDACWAAYREGAMYGVLLFVGMASQVEENERADAMITDQIRRYAEMAIDLQAPQAAGLV
jgi:hypothetical protein